jgi:hypothetical protein
VPRGTRLRPVRGGVCRSHGSKATG